MRNYAIQLPETLYIPPNLTTIILPTLNEEKYVSRAILSIQSQNIVQAAPQRFEFLVVDSESDDSTAAIASSMGVTVVSAPRGKLSARDIGIREAKGDVIFATDADTFYPPNHLNLMLRHFQDASTVAVYGNAIIEDPPLIWAITWLRTFIPPRRMLGNNSGFRKDAYFKIGGFDLSIDQQDNEQMVQEEEFRLFDRFESVGKVAYEMGTAAMSSGRRWTGADSAWSAEVKARKRFIEEAGYL